LLFVVVCNTNALLLFQVYSMAVCIAVIAKEVTNGFCHLALAYSWIFFCSALNISSWITVKLLSLRFVSGVFVEQKLLNKSTALQCTK